jgi:TRAP-type mannitol/chloroaromatic compound transport system permease large subunit
MLPGFFLTFLYLVYILGWAIINPKIAPKLAPDQYRVQVSEWLKRLERGPAKRVFGGFIALLFYPAMVRGAKAADGRPFGYGQIVTNFLALMIPLILTVGTYAGTWWYVVIYNAPATAAAAKSETTTPAPSVATAPEKTQELGAADEQPKELGSSPAQPQQLGNGAEKPLELGQGETTVQSSEPVQPADAPPQEMTSLAEPSAVATSKVPEHFYAWFWSFVVFSVLLLSYYYWRMDGEQFEILKELVISVVPLGVLTAVVLVVILLGICTATESAAVGALGALYLAVMVKYPRPCAWWSLAGAFGGFLLGLGRNDTAELVVAASLGATFLGTGVPLLQFLPKSPELRQNLKEATFLTAKTTAMVCWLFVGSALFSAVFALHGGQGVIERWALGMNLSPVGFLIMSQLIIFLLGWPLEWTEIIVIFCPIFIPLLAHFQVDPLLFGTMVAVNLQAAFLSPPVAMSAFYLKGVAPKHVTLNQIFAGMMPYMLIVILCLAFMYIWPGMTLWLPEFLYGD